VRHQLFLVRLHVLAGQFTHHNEFLPDSTGNFFIAWDFRVEDPEEKQGLQL